MIHGVHPLPPLREEDYDYSMGWPLKLDAKDFVRFLYGAKVVNVKFSATTHDVAYGEEETEEIALEKNLEVWRPGEEDGEETPLIRADKPWHMEDFTLRAYGTENEFRPEEFFESPGYIVRQDYRYYPAEPPTPAKYGVLLRLGLPGAVVGDIVPPFEDEELWTVDTGAAVLEINGVEHPVPVCYKSSMGDGDVGYYLTDVVLEIVVTEWWTWEESGIMRYNGGTGSVIRPPWKGEGS